MLILLVIGFAIACATPAQAHFFPANMGPAAGFIHPLTGPDHLLAMFSVGVLSTRYGSRTIWSLPAVFIVGMIAGGLLGIARVQIAHDETGIAVSVLALGLIIACGLAPTRSVAHLCVLLFGFWHGHAHGIEAPTVTHEVVLYFVGFLASTAGLHIMGVLSGLIIQEYQSERQLAGGFGAVVAGIGFYFLVA